MVKFDLMGVRFPGTINYKKLYKDEKERRIHWFKVANYHRRQSDYLQKEKEQLEKEVKYLKIGQMKNNDPHEICRLKLELQRRNNVITDIYKELDQERCEARDYKQKYDEIIDSFNQMGVMMIGDFFDVQPSYKVLEQENKCLNKIITDKTIKNKKLQETEQRLRQRLNTKDDLIQALHEDFEVLESRLEHLKEKYDEAKKDHQIMIKIALKKSNEARQYEAELEKLRKNQYDGCYDEQV